MKITLYAHPLAPVAPQVFEADSLAQWLLGHYGASPAVRVQIFRGEPCADNEISNDIRAILAGEADEYVILQSPGFEALAAVAWYVWVAIAVAVVLVISLVPKPNMPGNVNRTQQSPNNALGDRSNKLRLLERVEDIYGTVKSIPSLMMPTYNKYIGNIKVEYGYYCIGRGYYDASELRDADTLIADIPGASAAVYSPFTSPNSGHAPQLQIGSAVIDNVMTVSRAIEVDGITLKALNQVQLPASAIYTFKAAGTITQAMKKPNINSVVVVGDSLVVAMAPAVVVSAVGSITANAIAKTFTDNNSGGIFAPPLFDAIMVGDTVTTAGFATAGNNGAWTVSAKVLNQITVTAAPINEVGPAGTVSVMRNYSGTYPVTGVSDGAATVTGAAWPASAQVTCSVQITGKSEYTPWVTLPKTDRSEVWCNVTAPNGMIKDSGGKSVAAVNFVIEIEKLSALLAPLGIVETVTGTLSGSVSDERADTIERATAWAGPARVRMRRTTDYDYG